MRVWCVALYLLLIGTSAAEPPELYKPGTFQGTLKLQPVGDGVHMSVLEDFEYTDGYKRSLEAAPGFVSDGASIPRVLWTVVGSPFTGKYVNAAIIHDVGCVNHKYTWQETHRLFYNAMLDSGVEKNYAKVLYYGVLIGGPKWKRETIRADEVNKSRSQIEAKGGKLEIEHDATESASYSAPSSPRHVLLLYPRQKLTQSEVKRFQEELGRRENLNSPITPEEIEARSDVRDAQR